MKLTKNYGLKKPDGEDFYNVQDFNDNADAIDAALAAKPDLPAAAEPGHFAAFSAGGIADSGKAAADFLPAGTTPADRRGDGAGAFHALRRAERTRKRRRKALFRRRESEAAKGLHDRRHCREQRAAGRRRGPDLDPDLR